MRRVVFALLSTVFGTALLVGLKAPGILAPRVAANGTQDPAGGGDPNPTGGDPNATNGPTPGQSGKPGTTPSPGASTKPGTSQSPKPGTTTTKPPTTGGGGGGAFSGTKTGNAIDVKNGTGSTCGSCAGTYTIKVTVTITNGVVTGVSTSNTATGSNSGFASTGISFMEPQANGVKSSSVSLNTSSGATYASKAWLLSFKSALKAAGL